MCAKHAQNHGGGTLIDEARLVAALREIATGQSGEGARVDAAVMQTIAKQALGMLG